MQKHLYLISGLGADERIFNNLRFPGHYQVHYLPWIAPLLNEPIGQYASRMARGIKADGPITLIGVSFGGIISLEIARHIPVEKNILLSSIKLTSEKPPYYKWIRLMKLHKLPDQILFQYRGRIVRKFLNVETASERKLVDDYLLKRDHSFLRWAVNAILYWENEVIPTGLIHIHGAKDLPFPVKYVTPTHLIPDGGHFMVLNRAAAINKILANTL